MRKNIVFLVALASATLATSCSEDDFPVSELSNSEIAVRPVVGNMVTRASETTTENLCDFRTYSFLTDDPKNYMDNVKYTNTAGSWGTDAGTFFWPVKGNLNFYSYAPEKPGREGNFAISATSQKLTGFVPYATAAAQQDFIYSKATGNLKDNANGIDFNFSHALSEITIKALNNNPAYTVEVTGVKVGNVISKGDFTFPTLSGSTAYWSLGSQRSDYVMEWGNATTLSSTASSLDAANTPLMLIPQQLYAEEQASAGNYLALKIKATNPNGSVIYDGWTYAAIPTRWEMNKCYDYTVDFSNGLGQKPGGEPIVNTKELEVSVSVNPWGNVEIELPLCISGHNLNNSEVNLNVGPGEVTVTMFDDNTWKYEVKGWQPSGLHFFLMPSLESVNLSSLDATNITDMSQMFLEHENLTTVKMNGINFHSVTNMKEMFCGCRKLTSIDLFGYQSFRVTDMNSMFRDCTSLTSADTWNWYTGIDCDMTSMFKGCTSLQTATAYVSLAKSTSQMFSGCNKLTSLSISPITSNIEDMSYMLKNCRSLKRFTINAIYSPIGMKYLNNMFQNCESLEEVNVRSIMQYNVTDASFMFQGCKSLKSLNITGCDASQVLNMESMFQGCKSLESLDLSSWNTKWVRNISQMFEGCTSLITLDLSGWNTAYVTNRDDVFKDCSSLKTIYMVGCDETTIAQVKACLIEAGLSTDIVKTKK